MDLSDRKRDSKIFMTLRTITKLHSCLPLTNFFIQLHATGNYRGVQGFPRPPRRYSRWFYGQAVNPGLSSTVTVTGFALLSATLVRESTGCSQFVERRGRAGRAGPSRGLGKKLQYHGSSSVKGVSEEVRCVGFCARWGHIGAARAAYPASHPSVRRANHPSI
jgi:hypothetical protein